MGSLITIDPSLTGTGVALWDCGELTCACAVGSAGHDLVYRVCEIAGAISSNATRAVIEAPQTYSGRAQKGDANDLISVGVLVGAIAYRLAQTMDVQLVTPRDWKGQTPKDVTERQCLAKLSKEELSRVALPKSKKQRSDVWDAIGIGLWVLRR